MRRILSYISLFCTTLFVCFIAFLVVLFLKRKEDLVHGMARFWARVYLLVGGINVTFHGGDHLKEPPYIIMSNHQSALDIMSLLIGLPVPFKFVAKQELFRIPIFGWGLKQAGYVSLDRANPRKALKDMEVAAQKIKEGASLVIFPEGTRSVDGKLLPFKKGAFSLAMKAGVPIVPLGIVGTALLQPEGYDVPIRKGNVTIVAGKPIPVEGKGTGYKDDLAERVRGEIEKLAGIRQVTSE